MMKVWEIRVCSGTEVDCRVWVLSRTLRSGSRWWWWWWSGSQVTKTRNRVIWLFVWCSIAIMPNRSHCIVIDVLHQMKNERVIEWVQRRVFLPSVGLKIGRYIYFRCLSLDACGEDDLFCPTSTSTTCSSCLLLALSIVLLSLSSLCLSVRPRLGLLGVAMLRDRSWCSVCMTSSLPCWPGTDWPNLAEI